MYAQSLCVESTIYLHWEGRMDTVCGLLSGWEGRMDTVCEDYSPLASGKD